MSPKRSRYTLALLGVIAFGLLVLVIGSMVLHQQNTRLSRMKNAYKAAKLKHDTIVKELETLPDREQELARLERQLNSVDQNLVDYEYMPTYLEQIQQTAARTGNTIRSLRPGELKVIDLRNSPLAGNTATGDTTKGKRTVRSRSAKKTDADAAAKQGYRVQKIALEVQGSYDSLLSLLEALRGFRKMVYVKSLTISPVKGDKEARGEPTLLVRLETYAIITPDQYQRQPEVKSTAAVAATKEAAHE